MKSLLLLVPLLLSCSNTQSTCSAGESGFGSAPAVTLSGLAAPPIANGTACRARFDLLRSQSELAGAFAELGLVDPPAVDFANEVVIVRVAADAASVVWSVRDNGGIVVGLQSCSEPTNTDCSAAFYRAPAPVASVDSRTCESVRCGFTASN